MTGGGREEGGPDQHAAGWFRHGQQQRSLEGCSDADAEAEARKDEEKKLHAAPRLATLERRPVRLLLAADL